MQYDSGGGLTLMAEYEYDGLGRRIAHNESGSLQETIRYAHDGQTMMAKCDDNSGSLTLKRTYVNGSQYIDEHVLMRDQAGSGKDYYYLLEELYSIAGLATSNGLRAEQVVYDSYGQATIYEWSRDDVNGDGNINIFDLVLIRDHLNTNQPLYDVNFDGAVNIFDLVEVRDHLNTSASLATVYSSVDNPFYFTGRLTDTLHTGDGLLVAEDPHFLRLQDNRHRTYIPKHGRWYQRDPLLYVDGVNLYQYIKSNPWSGPDPFGTQAAAAPNPIQIVIIAGGAFVARCGLPYAEYANKKWPASDKFKHCWVSCMISRDCGKCAAAALGFAKEWKDSKGSNFSQADSDEDKKANAAGRACAGFECWFGGAGWYGRWFRASCEDCCKSQGYKPLPEEDE